MNKQYRSSFNGIVCVTEGAYKVYGITKEEYQHLMIKHNGKLSGSDGNYTIYDEAKTYAYIKLYVNDLNRRIKFDIRNQILSLTGMKKISPKLLKLLNENMPKIIYVESINNRWVFVDQNLLYNVIKEIGYLAKCSL